MGGIKKLGIITVMVLLLCSGCGKKALPVEDYVSSNPAKVIYNAVMKTDTGYYYGSSEKKMSIHYYDVGSGQNIFCAAGRSVVIMEMHFVLQPVINTLLTQCVCMVESCI